MWRNLWRTVFGTDSEQFPRVGIGERRDLGAKGWYKPHLRFHVNFR